MKTELLKVNEESVALGAKLIREGELVGFPDGDGLRAGRKRAGRARRSPRFLKRRGVRRITR